ncbi:hypothetical protein DFA_01382 [Cavenderia fasciculata]|uniref:Uncharacterized protein n=1 Tax=Cavenderia fasciculata TaxID=261658 RepID=F4PSG6_CACFS|nr:uncharacterized protein DFA_01382 [Cavenderia fasciculata]EGG21496.1 hypothetical protein DFA_01382 [Cavenderia fasciculata]|eukprot:XP_004359346.1 hypothetical protein DFA_01382 [Cavenderia fasciculata]
MSKLICLFLLALLVLSSVLSVSANDVFHTDHSCDSVKCKRGYKCHEGKCKYICGTVLCEEGAICARDTVGLRFCKGSK